MSQIILAIRFARPLTSLSDVEVAVQDKSFHASEVSCRLKVRSGSKEVFFSNGMLLRGLKKKEVWSSFKKHILKLFVIQ